MGSGCARRSRSACRLRQSSQATSATSSMRVDARTRCPFRRGVRSRGSGRVPVDQTPVARARRMVVTRAWRPCCPFGTRRATPPSRQRLPLCAGDPALGAADGHASPPSARPRALASTGAAVMSPSTRLPVLVQSIDDLSLGATKQRDDPKPKRRKPVRLALANVMSPLRGDKYIGAYAVAGARMTGRGTRAE
jgi:hypothetical protein